MAEYVCPNGHAFPRAFAAPCDLCGAAVACEPVAAGKFYFDALTEDALPALRQVFDVLEAAPDDTTASEERAAREAARTVLEKYGA